MTFSSAPLIASITLVSIGVFTPSSVFAQTPVSTTMHMSGSCNGCELTERKLTHLTLRGSSFQSSNFTQSNLSGSKIYQSDISNAIFNKAFLVRVIGEEVNFEGTSFQDATLTEAKITSSNFNKANFKGTDLTRGVFKNSNFSNTVLKSVEAPQADFSGTLFSDASIKHSNFEGASFSRAILKNTDFGQSSLDNVNFDNADITGADLSDALGISHDQLAKACGDQNTKLPSGLKVNICKPSIQALDTRTPAFRQGQSALFQRYSKSQPTQLTITLSQDDYDTLIRDIDEHMLIIPKDSHEQKRLSKLRHSLTAQDGTAPPKRK